MLQQRTFSDADIHVVLTYKCRYGKCNKIECVWNCFDIWVNVEYN